MKREGFTLIELIVVIAIITFMIAITLPILQIARQLANGLICGSHIKQLVLGLTIYEEDNETFPYAFDFTNEARSNPPPGGFAGNPIYNKPGWWWFNQINILDYSKKSFNKDTVFWCPSRNKINRSLKYNVLCGNYGVNLSICKRTSGNRNQAEFNGTPLSRNDIQRHSETLLIIDSGYSMINWWHAGDTPPEPLGNSIEDTSYVPGLKINKEKNLMPGLEEDAKKGRHLNRTVNIGFVDGHVNHTKADFLLVEKTEAGYQNCYPLWQPIKTYRD